MTVPFPTEYRIATEADIGFVVSSWIKSYHDGAPAVRVVPFKRYRTAQREVIARAMELGQTIVACDSGDRDSIYGFACGVDDGGEGVLHYVYVLQTRRRYGLARELIGHVGAAAKRRISCYSHSTITGSRVAQRLGLSHNPFALVRLLHEDRKAIRSERDSHAGAGTDPGVSRGI